MYFEFDNCIACSFRLTFIHVLWNKNQNASIWVSKRVRRRVAPPTASLATFLYFYCQVRIKQSHTFPTVRLLVLYVATSHISSNLLHLRSFFLFAHLLKLLSLLKLLKLSGMWVSRPGLGLETDQDHFFEVLVLVSTLLVLVLVSACLVLVSEGGLEQDLRLCATATLLVSKVETSK